VQHAVCLGRASVSVLREASVGRGGIGSDAETDEEQAAPEMLSGRCKGRTPFSLEKMLETGKWVPPTSQPLGWIAGCPAARDEMGVRGSHLEAKWYVRASLPACQSI